MAITANGIEPGQIIWISAEECGEVIECATVGIPKVGPITAVRYNENTFEACSREENFQSGCYMP